MPPQNIGIGALLDSLRPYLTDLAAVAIRNALVTLPVSSYAPGTVISVDKTAGTCIVQPDGPAGGGNIPAQYINGAPPVNGRVMLLFAPPSGVYALGWINTPPWASAWGIVGNASEITADQLIANTAGEFQSSLNGTWTTIAGRKYKITLTGRGLQSSLATDQIEIYVKEDGTQIMGGTAYMPGNNATIGPLSIARVRPALTGGSHVYIVYLSRSNGTGLGGFIASATRPITLMLEDIGPV